MRGSAVFVAVVVFAAVLSAQAPLPEALRAARLVYLEQGRGINRATLDKAAKEMQKFKPRRLELVSERDRADLILELSDASVGPGGVVYAPIGGMLFGIPVRDTVYRLTARPPAEDLYVWNDQSANLGRLVKGFLKRLAADVEQTTAKPTRAPATMIPTRRP